MALPHRESMAQGKRLLITSDLGLISTLSLPSFPTISLCELPVRANRGGSVSKIERNIEGKRTGDDSYF